MNALISSSNTLRPYAAVPRQLLLMAFGSVGLMLFAVAAWAANNNGVALQGAFNLINDIVGGFGKQLLTVLGFAVAALGYMATNATSIVMKFVGFAVFLGVGLAAAIGVVGAVI